MVTYAPLVMCPVLTGARPLVGLHVVPLLYLVIPVSHTDTMTMASYWVFTSGGLSVPTRVLLCGCISLSLKIVQAYLFDGSPSPFSLQPDVRLSQPLSLSFALTFLRSCFSVAFWALYSTISSKSQIFFLAVAACLFYPSINIKT